MGLAGPPLRRGGLVSRTFIRRIFVSEQALDSGAVVIGETFRSFRMSHGDIRIHTYPFNTT